MNEKVNNIIVAYSPGPGAMLLWDLPIALVAVTCTSSGKQPWNHRSLFCVTVISSFDTEFIFISQSEYGLFLIWREAPSSLLVSTLHDAAGDTHHIRYLCISVHMRGCLDMHIPAGILFFFVFLELSTISRILKGGVRRYFLLSSVTQRWGNLRAPLNRDPRRQKKPTLHVTIRYSSALEKRGLRRLLNGCPCYNTTGRLKMHVYIWQSDACRNT